MPKCPKCARDGIIQAMTLSGTCPVCDELPASVDESRARYLAVYGAMVAAQVIRAFEDARDPRESRDAMRAIVALAHDVARRSEDAQP